MSVVGEVLSSHLVPKAILEIIQQPAELHQSGFSDGFCWVLDRQQLYFWRYEDASDARLRALNVPRQASGKCFVRILPQPRASSVSVVVCSELGHVFIWLDAQYTVEPSRARLFTADDASSLSSAQRLVTGFDALVADTTGLGPAFVAAVGAADGSWVLLHCTSQGVSTKHLVPPPPGAADASLAARGVLGALGSLVSAAYTEAFVPIRKYLKAEAACSPVLGVRLQQVDHQRWKVYVATQATLDCWLVSD